MNLKEIQFCATHPRDAVEAGLRQMKVAVEIESPPAGSTIEEFPELSLSEAAALIRAEQQSQSQGDATNGLDKM